jgi:hypothetical protein
MCSMHRRDFLKSTAAISMLGLAPSIAAASGHQAKRVVVVRAFGGWDVTFCMDPRNTSSTIDGPDWNDGGSTNEVITSYGGIPIMKNTDRRPAVDTFFTANASNTLVVNGIYTGSIVHEECRKRIITGSRDVTAADVGALSAVTSGTEYTLPYLDLTGGARVGSYAAQTGSLGRNNQILALVDRDVPLVGPLGSDIRYPIFTPNPAQREGIENYLSARNQAWQSRGFTDSASAKRIADLQEAYSRKLSLYEDRALLQDNLVFGQSGDLTSQAVTAVELMKAGLCHSASLDTGFSWDTHDDIDDQNGMYESLFTGLSQLVSGLKAEGLFDDTLIVVVSEMTRTPKMNADSGKDHWPSTSAMLISGDLAGGRVLGGSTPDTLDADFVDLSTGELSSSSTVKINFDNFAAGVLHASGVDSTTHLPNVEVLHGIVD